MNQRVSRRITRMRSGENGFTLIEVLIVVLVIGILAAIAIPSFLSQNTKGTDASAESAATNLRKAVSYCYLDTRYYPSCSTATEVPNTGLKWGSGPGTVAVAYQPYGLTDSVAFEAVAGDGTTYAVVKSISQETAQLLCITASGHYPVGNCRAGGSLGGHPVGQW